MTVAIDTVRRIVGRRSKITRDEMADIIEAIGIAPERSTIVSVDRDRDGQPNGHIYDGSRMIEPVLTRDASMPPSMRSIDREATAASQHRADAYDADQA